MCQVTLNYPSELKKCLTEPVTVDGWYSGNTDRQCNFYLTPSVPYNGYTLPSNINLTQIYITLPPDHIKQSSTYLQTRRIYRLTLLLCVLYC